MDRTPLTPERLVLIGRIVKRLTSVSHLSPEDAEDFQQSVYLRLLERQCDVFERFEGRSALSTYLAVVIYRMLQDWRTSQRGKWRPTTAVVALGRTAVALDRLINRDGFTKDEAVEIMRSQVDPQAVPTLQDLVDRIPRRMPVRTQSVADLTELPAEATEDALEARETRSAALRWRRALAMAVRRLPMRDRKLLYERYARGKTIKSIAESLSSDPAVLYREFR